MKKKMLRKMMKVITAEIAIGNPRFGVGLGWDWIASFPSVTGTR